MGKDFAMGIQVKKEVFPEIGLAYILLGKQPPRSMTKAPVLAFR
jgi:hypothetical protein